jgi:hypothetical protein
MALLGMHFPSPIVAKGHNHTKNSVFLFSKYNLHVAVLTSFKHRLCGGACFEGCLE